MTLFAQSLMINFDLGLKNLLCRKVTWFPAQSPIMGAYFKGKKSKYLAISEGSIIHLRKCQ